MNKMCVKAFTVDGQLVGVYRSRPSDVTGWATVRTGLKLGLEDP